MEKHRLQGLIQQADAKQQQVQESIAARPRGGAQDELISELIQSRLAVSRAQMNAEAGVSEQMIEEQQEIIAWLWRVLEHTGMSQTQVRLLLMHMCSWAYKAPLTLFGATEHTMCYDDLLTCKIVFMSSTTRQRRHAKYHLAFVR